MIVYRDAGSIKRPIEFRAQVEIRAPNPKLRVYQTVARSRFHRARVERIAILRMIDGENVRIYQR